MAEPRLGPVLKWAGGKRQLLPEILKRLPTKIATYYEPFVGGGAVFFELAAQGRFERAVIADQNRDLLDVYRALQCELPAVIARLEAHVRRHSEDEYYRVREQSPRNLSTRAARIIYLNKTGFNGLYRVNRSGQFNVPFGRYARPKILDREKLEAASAALANVEIVESDFEAVCARAGQRDAVYLDPPYLPVSRTAKFAEYHSAPFGLDEHRRLAAVFADLQRRGVRAVLSNSNTEETRELFRSFRLEFVSARRSINSDPTARGPVREILVSTRAARGKSLHV